MTVTEEPAGWQLTLVGNQTEPDFDFFEFSGAFFFWKDSKQFLYV